MTVETDLQRDIRKSVIKQGGYAIKLSNRFTIGVPDLLIALAPFAPCYAEVKKLGWCIPTFNRQLGVTPKQRYELGQFSGQYLAPVSFIFVGVELGEKCHSWLVARSWDACNLTGEYVSSTDSKVPRETGGMYDVAHLLKTMGAGKVAQ